GRLAPVPRPGEELAGVAAGVGAVMGEAPVPYGRGPFAWIKSISDRIRTAGRKRLQMVDVGHAGRCGGGRLEVPSSARVHSPGVPPVGLVRDRRAGAEGSTGSFAGCPGLQAGGECDPCGAGQGKPLRSWAERRSASSTARRTTAINQEFRERSS